MNNNFMKKQLTYSMTSNPKRCRNKYDRALTESNSNYNSTLDSRDLYEYNQQQRSRIEQENRPTFDYMTDLQKINLEYQDNLPITQNNDYVYNDSFLCSSKVKPISQSRNANTTNVQNTLSNQQTQNRPKTLSSLTMNKINKMINENLMKKMNNNPSKMSNYSRTAFSAYSNSIPNKDPRFIFGNTLSPERQNKYYDKRYSPNAFKGDNNNIKEEQGENQDMTQENIQDKDMMGFKTIDEFNAYLKEENQKLKKTNFAYKQLIDTLFYFVNSLSHKYSFNKTFFEIAYYTEHLDELTKSLLELEKCIASSIDLTILQRKHQEFLAQLKVTNEFQITLPIINEDELNKYKEKDLPNRHHPIYSFGDGLKEQKSVDSTNTQHVHEKDGRECIACLLGASVSQRGYSPMKFNPYKKFNSSQNMSQKRLAQSRSFSGNSSDNRSLSKNSRGKSKSPLRKNIKVIKN